MHLWHLNNMKVILTLQALRYVDCIPFLYWFFIMFIIEPSIFKKFYFPLSENHDQTSIDLNNVFEFNMIVHLYQKIYYMKIYNKVTIWVSELILTSYSSFDMKCIKPNVKKKPGLHSIMGSAPWYLLEFLWIKLQYSVQSLCSIEDGALCDKK